jgi:hypothetical protein
LIRATGTESTVVSSTTVNIDYKNINMHGLTVGLRYMFK